MTLLDLTGSCVSAIAPGDGLPPRAWRRDESLRLALDGLWRFHYAQSIADAPTNCDEEHFDDSNWDELAVPSHWVLDPAGRYGHPIYTNVQLPIPLDPPFVPDRNAIGDYRRTFDLPEGWDAHASIRLRFDGVESLGIVAVNGQHIGVLRGSRLPSELDVTAVVHPGTNTVHVRVLQWSAQTYVEDQDQWWLPGIFREVALIARPEGCIEDHWIDGGFDHQSGTGVVRVELTSTSFPVRLQIPALEVDVTWRSPAEIQPVPCSKVEPWSPDHPRLYQVELSNEVDRVRERIGFRTISLVGNSWLVNGTKLRIRGVNRHESNPWLGRVFDEAACREGLLEMKRANINAIRTSHYPPHPRLFDLADELGFWVMSECDLESHGFVFVNWEGNPTDDPRWRDSLTQRMERTIRRDRNHPSIICWSLGNESGTGANLAAMAEISHRLDPSRPVHYEGDYEAAYSDLVSRMYSPLPELEALSLGRSSKNSPRPTQASRFLDKPKILCEFGHAMGNGPGGIGEYVAAFEQLADWHGGFIWEWRDHGIASTTEDGIAYFAYGGDFGEDPNDGNFVMDGLLHSDGTVSPAVAELRQQFSPVTVNIGNDVWFENRFHAIDTAHLVARWSWQVGGIERASGVFDDLVIPANSVATRPLPKLPGEAWSSPESYLTIRIEERHDRPWAPAGHTLVTAQRRLDDTPIPIAPRPTASAVINSDVHVAQVRLCPKSGRLLSIGDVPVREAGVELWRAPTDNDCLGEFGSYELGDFFSTGGYGTQGPSSKERWCAQGLHRLTRRTTSVGLIGGEFVVVERLIAAQMQHGAEITYRWSEVEGRACCRILVAPIRPRTDVTWPRIGYHLLLPHGLVTATWFGGGPGEAYPDSRAASIIGQHEALIDDLAFPYSVPQETGHREALRRLRLTGDDGALEWETFGPDLPGFCVLRHDAYELTAAQHQYELPESRGTHLYLDAFQHGLGSRSCGPDVLPKYQLWPRRAEFGFLVSEV